MKRAWGLAFVPMLTTLAMVGLAPSAAQASAEHPHLLSGGETERNGLKRISVGLGGGASYQPGFR
jgi:hypothetical protein